MLWFNVLHGHILAAFELNCFKRTCCKYTTIHINFCPTPSNDPSGCPFCSPWLKPCNIHIYIHVVDTLALQWIMDDGELYNLYTINSYLHLVNR